MFRKISISSFLTLSIFCKDFELLKDYKRVKKIDKMCLIHIYSASRMVELLQVDKLKLSKVHIKQCAYYYYRKITLCEYLSGCTLIGYITDKTEELLNACIRGGRIIEIRYPMNIPSYEYGCGRFSKKTICDLDTIECMLYNILEYHLIRIYIEPK